MTSLCFTFLLFSIVNFKGVLSLDTRQLPSGSSNVFTAPNGDATTTLYLDATRDGRFPIGVITSTVDKFIKGGTTTEYVTQDIGTHIDNKYARIASTSSREYYRVVQPTQGDSGETRDLVQPTGLIHSSVSYRVQGSQTTEYTIEHYRTFLDGHYAHLMSTISKVYSDPPVIVATPVYRPDGQLAAIGSSQQRDEFYFPREQIKPAKPTDADGVPTKTIGFKAFNVKSPKALRLNDAVEKESQDVELEENKIQVRSIDQAIILDPAPVAKDPETVPTFTVDESGDFKIPTPVISTEENEIEPTSVEHMSDKPSKTALDSVTFVGFVDFTTTIDDTVVVFSPKKTFRTATRNFLVNKVQPTAPLPEQVTPSSSSVPVIDSSQPERHRTSEPEEGNLPKFTSGINPLKSLLAASAARRNRLSKSSITFSSETSIKPTSTSSALLNTRPKITLIPSLRIPQDSEEERTEEPEVATPEPQVDEPLLESSIDLSSDVELVYKTLYTTYTYFTTFFRASSTRIKSREEVISNVVTLTNILDPTDLASLRSSCEVDSTCHFVSSTVGEPFTTGFIGRPNTKDPFPEVPRSSPDVPEDVQEDSENSILQTFYTTYTYFTTLFVDGTSSISTRTEVYSDIKSSGVPVSFFEDASSAIISTELSNVQPSASSSPSRLQYSSIVRGSFEEFTTEEEKVEIITEESVEPLVTTEEENEELPASEQEEESVDVPEEIPEEDLAEEIVEEELELEKGSEDEEKPIVDDEDQPTESTSEESEFITPTSIFDLEKELELEHEEEESTTETEEDVEVVSPAHAKTYYTTYTYFTTLFRNGTSFVTSNLETVTNVADSSASPVVVQPSVTFFTTFTYWTTSIDGDNTVITSREETKTDILPASVTELLSITPSSTVPIEVTQTATLEGEIENSSYAPWTGEETTTDVPELESGETEPNFNVHSAGNTVTPSLQSSSSVSFENLDEDFILSSSIGDSSSSVPASPIASRSRLSFSKSSRSLSPAIRPNLFRTRARPNLRFRGSTRTTVAIITRSEVTPTLIATPASSIVFSTPSLSASSSSSRRFSNRFVSSTAISASTASSERTAIAPSSVESDSNTPSIIPGLNLRRPSPFRARLKERQRQRLEKLRSQNENSEEEEDEPLVPSTPGDRTPIFISSKTEKIIPKTTTQDPLDESRANLPDNNRDERDNKRSRIFRLFKSRRPSILRPRPNFSSGRVVEDDDQLAVAESRRRRKRQVSSYYSEFGTRTSSSSRHQSRRQHQSPSSSSLSDQSSYQSPNPKRSASYYYDSNIDSVYSSARTSNTDLTNRGTSNVGRRQVRQNSDDTASLRSRSRFRGRTRAPVRSRQPIAETTTTTTTSRPPLRSRFRPRTISSGSSTRNRNQFSSQESTPNRFSSQSFRRPSTSDYDYSDYDYDYNVELESSQNSVPDFITVTHTVPIVTTINFGNNIKEVISTTPSLQVIAATDLKSTNIDGSPVIYANAYTETPALGTEFVTFDALRATETTTIVFTPTKIRGLRTSFSHIVPSTIYNIRSVTTTIVEPVDQNQLLTQLLLKLLAGQSQTQSQPVAQLPNLLQQNPAEPQTKYITHTSTTVTTITNVKSKVLPITLRGREIKTTLVESSTEVATITELSTETIVAPTPTAALGPAAPVLPTANPLEGLLGADLQQQLLLAQLQQQLQQQALGQQVVTAPTADSLTQAQLIQPSPIEQTVTVTQTKEPDQPIPKTSVVTVFVSGKSPDEFTRITSTVIVDEPNQDEPQDRKKRNIEPTSTAAASVQPTQDLGLLLTLPDLPFAIYPSNNLQSSQNRPQKLFTLFPNIISTVTVQ